MLTLFGAGCAVLLVVDVSRFYRLDFVHPLFELTCWTAAFALLGIFAPRLAAKRAVPLMTLSAFLCILLFPLWLYALEESDPNDVTAPRIVAVQPSPDGRVHAVTESFYGIIDPSCRVLLREPDGLFARQTLIWQMTESGCPRVWFPDNTTIRIDRRNGEPMQISTFDPDRMQVTDTSVSN
ncbi:hypothetical protein ACFVUS_29500 [Nocardia sp. NPDC058058]|uniref:hypothetical protein n=1 Tax=Nocardia sp. NPDC058058 TaxID=3346317 RepID=UPI0036DB44AB